MRTGPFLVTALALGSIALHLPPSAAAIAPRRAGDPASVLDELHRVMQSVAATTSVPASAKKELAARMAAIEQRVQEISAAAAIVKQEAVDAATAANEKLERLDVEIARHNAQPHEFELPKQAAAASAYQAEADAQNSQAARLGEQAAAAMSTFESADREAADFANSEAVRSLLRDAKQLVFKEDRALKDLKDLDATGRHDEIYDGAGRRDRDATGTRKPWKATVLGRHDGDVVRPPPAGSGARELDPKFLAPSATHRPQDASALRRAPPPDAALETTDFYEAARKTADSHARELERQFVEMFRKDPGDVIRQFEMKDAIERQRQQADYFEFKRRELERKASQSQRDQR
jgi:hypothetical protein